MYKCVRIYIHTGEISDIPPQWQVIGGEPLGTEWYPLPFCQCWSSAGILLQLLLLSTCMAPCFENAASVWYQGDASPPKSLFRHCVRAVCVVVAGTGIFRTFPALFSSHWEVREHIHGALLYS